jgi:hypothetical protein
LKLGIQRFKSLKKLVLQSFSVLYIIDNNIALQKSWVFKCIPMIPSGPAPALTPPLIQSHLLIKSPRWDKKVAKEICRLVHTYL